MKLRDEEIIRKLKGPRGTKVNVGIQRKGVTDLLHFEITRDKIPLVSVDVAYMISDSTGYIKISKFSRTTFEEFIEERFKYQDKEFYWHRAVRGWYPQKDHVTDEQGNIKCDVLRFEHLNDDLKEYFNLPKDQVIKSSNNFHRGNTDPEWAKWDIDYKTLYNDTTIQIIADWYKEDIEMFGFDYDTTATKNIWEQL